MLLVHRPKYDDWSFPKGKQDPGEDDVVTAVREVVEETGVEVRLGMPLPSHGLRAARRPHQAGPLLAGRGGRRPRRVDVRPNDEIDDVAWVPIDEAAGLLTYQRDRDVLAALATSRKTTPLVVLRHAKALSRKKWDGADPERPLTDEGQAQAKRLTSLLAAYGMTRVVTSSSTRCVQTVQPYVDEHVLTTARPSPCPRSTSTRDAVPRRCSTTCSPTPSRPSSARTGRCCRCCSRTSASTIPPLDPASLLVVHHRSGEILAAELHEAP